MCCTVYLFSISYCTSFSADIMITKYHTKDEHFILIRNNRNCFFVSIVFYNNYNNFFPLIFIDEINYKFG